MRSTRRPRQWRRSSLPAPVAVTFLAVAFLALAAPVSADTRSLVVRLVDRATAADAQMLGGRPADTYVHGRGDIDSGVATAPVDGTWQDLLLSNANGLVVYVALRPDGIGKWIPQVDINNWGKTSWDVIASEPLDQSNPSDQTNRATLSRFAFDEPSNMYLTLRPVDLVHVQLFHTDPNEVITLTISTESANEFTFPAPQKFAGQLTSGPD